MNNIFNAQRFFRLLNKHTKESLKEYLLCVAILIIILSAVLGAIVYNNGGHLPQKVQIMVFTTTFFVAGILITSMMFLDFSDKRKAIAELTLPVSTLERFLVLWFYSFIVYQITMVVCFYLVDLIAVHIGNQLMSSGNRQGKNEILGLVTPSGSVFKVFLTYGFLHSISFFGAVYFRKLHLIKTIFVVTAFVFLLVQLNKLIAFCMYNAGVTATMVFANLNVSENNILYVVEADQSALNVIKIMMLLLTFVLWAAAFFKLKEKQV